MQHRKSIWVFGTLAIAIVFLTQFCNSPQTTDAVGYLNHSDSAHYVGISTCAQCHLDKVQTFSHTGMGMSFDTASKSKSSANLTTNHVLYDSATNFYYYPFWKSDKLYVKEFRLDAKDTVYSRTEEITYIIGSGQHTNSHLVKKGDYIVQAPFTWYAQKGQLDFPPGFENGNNSRFSRVIDQECMSCHNAMPTMKPGSMKAFTYVPNGIDCERCHGPGSIHVNFRRTGELPSTDIDYTIVNPSNLQWERQIDVCQRCHLQGNNVLKEGKNFTDFRPGMVLSDIFEIFLPEYENGQLFNMANHSDRFQNSKCFIQSNKSGMSFTCISCHNPHVSVKNTATAEFNKKCESCHSSSLTTCSEQLKVRTLKGDNCVLCHMPSSSAEDIPHVSVHDHKIGIYSEGYEPKNDGEVKGLYSVNNDNPSKETLIKAYLTYFEKFDPLPIYQEKAKALLDESEFPTLKVHYYYQKQQWQDIVTLVEKTEIADVNGVTAYRIGKAYSSIGNIVMAIDWLKLSVLKQPTEFAIKSELGSNMLKIEDWESAESVLKECINQYSEYTPALNNLGYLYIRTGKYAQSKKFLTRVLALDPDNIKAIENFVLLYSVIGDKESELFWLQKLLERKPYFNKAKERFSQLKGKG